MAKRHGLKAVPCTGGLYAVDGRQRRRFNDRHMRTAVATISGDRPISRTVLAAIFITAIAASAFDDAFIVDDAARQMRRDGHTRILAHTATEPDRYRVLVPYLVEPVVLAIEVVTPEGTAIDAAYAVFYVCAFVWLVWTLFAYLALWFSERQALIGSLVAASTLRLTLQEYTPFSILEPGFFALALLFAYRQRRAWLGIIVAIAALNRETAVFLPLAYAVTSPPTRRNVTTTAALLAIWAAIFLGVRYLFGGGTRYWTLDTIWAWNRNPEHLLLTVLNITLLLGAFWIFAALGYQRSPPFVRRSALVIPPYIAAVLVWGVWSEVRLLTPLYPILFSLALSFLFEPSALRRTPFDRRGVILAILVTAAGVTAYHYSFLVPRASMRIATHEAVVHRTADSPERFRVLVPFAVEAVARPAAMFMPYEKAVGRVYAAYYLIAITSLLFACFTYFSRFWSREAAMIGALLLADTMHIALRQGEYLGQLPIPGNAVFAPHSLLEPILLAVALIATLDRRWIWVPIIAGVAALNSEAALLIPVAILAAGSNDSRATKAAGICAANVVAVLVLVRLALGGPWIVTSVGELWRLNTSNLPTALLNIVLFLGGVWLLALFGFAKSPRLLRRVTAMAAPVYVAAFLLFAVWWDVRVLMPLYPIVVPLALAFVS
jgi:hypothetical protein